MSNAPKSNTVVEKDANSGGLIVALHPLVLIHISDHWTRMKYQNGQENPRVIGVILGTQTGRNVEICTAWELNYTVKNGAVSIDQDYLIKKQEQCIYHLFNILPTIPS
jgi:COP9 signalosome complex subunit 6